MRIDEIIRGESRNVEFKVKLPDISEKYTKTIVAFANTQGGQLIVGVDDVSRKVVGVDNDEAFKIMDSIANAVSDSCMPQIVPNIELQTVDNKTVIVVTVTPGPNRPYYLKSKGKENGTFIRVAGTTRPAHSEKIKELEMEGAHISWDELTCIGFEVSREAKEKLCMDIMKYRKEAGLQKWEVTDAQLVNWKLLKNGEDSLLASNAFVLLTSDYFPFSKTQCAVFKGTKRTVFLDKREFTGPVYEQIEEATAFVLRNIRLGATIEGLVRKESYELPVEAIREMIINAHCHRNLYDSSCVQVAVYDDRLEVTSPGGLYNGLTYEEIMNGHSKLRNRVIANVFSQMGLVESWGTGIKRIMDAAESYGLPVPSIQVFDDMFRVNLYRNQLLMPRQNNVNLMVESGGIINDTIKVFGESSEKIRRKFGEDSEKDIFSLNGIQGKILELIRQNSRISAKAMAEILLVSSRTIEKNIKILREQGILVRHGSPKNGFWEIRKK